MPCLLRDCTLARSRGMLFPIINVIGQGGGRSIVSCSRSFQVGVGLVGLSFASPSWTSMIP